MDSESNEQISSIMEKVMQTWQLIGLNEGEKKRIIQEVTKKVIGEYSTLLKEGEEKRLCLERGNEEMMKEMIKIISVLKDVRMDDEKSDFSSLLDKNGHLKKKLEDLTEVKEEREGKLIKLHDTFVHLYSQMGDTCENCSVDPDKPLSKSDLSMENIGMYEKIVEEMKILMVDRIEIYEDRLNEIRSIEDELKIDTAFSPKQIKSSSKRSNEQHNLDLRWEELENMKLVLENLKYLKEERINRIKIFKKNIENLLKEMNLNPSDSSNFLQKHKDLTPQCLKTLQTEENRLKQALKLQMESLVKGVYEEITKKYDELHSAEKDRMMEPVLTSSFEESQKTLSSLREYLNVLCKELESRKSIYELITKRSNMREKKNKLEELESDSSRLLSKKANMILLEENKLRQEVSKLPKLESALIEKIQAWQKLYQKQFLYDGEDYIEVINNDNSQDKMDLLKKKEKRLFDKVNKENKSTATLSIMEPLNQSIRVTQRTQTPSSKTPSKNPPSSVLNTPSSKKPKNDTENTTPMRSTTRHNRDVTNTPSQKTPVSKSTVSKTPMSSSRVRTNQK